MTRRESRELFEPRLDPIVSGGALKAIVLAALTRGDVVTGDPHLVAHMYERHFEISDVIHVLENGDYSRFEKKWHGEFENWCYAVCGNDTNGKPLKIIFTVEDPFSSTIRPFGGQRWYKGKLV